MLRLIIKVVVASIVALTGVSAVRAGSAPSLPEHPTSADCREFRAAYQNYLASLRAADRACFDAHWPASAFEAHVRIACHPVGVAQSCAAEAEESACAHTRFGSLINQCDARARTLAATAAGVDDSILERSLFATPSGLPGFAIRNALRLGSFVSLDDTTKTLARGAGTVAFLSRRYSELRTASGHDDPLERIRAAASLGSRMIDQKLSRELLRMSLDGVIRTHQTALAGLVSELENISAAHAAQVGAPPPKSSPQIPHGEALPERNFRSDLHDAQQEAEILAKQRAAEDAEKNAAMLEEQRRAVKQIDIERAPPPPAPPQIQRSTGNNGNNTVGNVGSCANVPKIKQELYDRSCSRGEPCYYSIISRFSVSCTP